MHNLIVIDEMPKIHKCVFCKKEIPIKTIQDWKGFNRNKSFCDSNGKKKLAGTSPLVFIDIYYTPDLCSEIRGIFLCDKECSNNFLKSLNEKEIDWQTRSEKIDDCVESKKDTPPIIAKVGKSS